jgi:hypothetical protein
MAVGKGELGTNISSLSFAIDIQAIFKPNFDKELIAELS